MTNHQFCCLVCSTELGDKHYCPKCGHYNRCDRSRYGCSCNRIPLKYQGIVVP